MRALSLASYYHAQQNPFAAGFGTSVTAEDYDCSRLVAGPLRLYDCSRENDGAAALILTSAERAKGLKHPPVYLLAAAMGCGPNWGELDKNQDPLTSAGQKEVAERVWNASGYGPSDVDCVQLYLNMTGPGVASLIDHGFCTAESAGEVLTFENLIAPAGRLPVNTAGGDLAEGFIHGMLNPLEAVRQIRGTSPNQVLDARLCLVTGGPMSEISSSALFGSAAAL